MYSKDSIYRVYKRVDDIDSLIRYLLVNNRKEEGIKYWEENTIKQINLATME